MIKKNLKIKSKRIFFVFIIFFFFLIFADKYVQAEKTAAPAMLNLEVPIFTYTQVTSLAEYIKTIYKYALYVLVPIAIIIIIWAGIQWIVAGGNLAKIKQAKKYITAALTGLFIGLLSYVILSLVGITELKNPTIEYIEEEEIPTAEGGELSDYNADYAQTGAGKSKWDIELGNVYSSKETKTDAKGNQKITTVWHCPGIQTTSVSCPKIGTSFRVNVKALPAFTAACNNLPSGLPRLVNGGSYNCRGNVNSAGHPSMHAYGIAFDIDPTNNQNCKPKPVTATCPVCGTTKKAGCCGQDLEKKKAIMALNNPVLLCTRAKEFGCTCNLPPAFIMSMINSGFKWGGTYSHTYDAMHFEVRRK